MALGRRRLALHPIASILCTLLLPACLFGSGESSDRAVFRLGYLPNLTQAPALLGIANGLFRKELRGVAELELQSFNAGPSAVEALFSDALDAAYMGPGPAINAFIRSRGEAIRIVSGATEGGAALVVQPSISGAHHLKGKKVASPHLGNSQDIALRTWLRSHRLRTNLQGGGDVFVVPQENAQTLETFRLGEIAGAWVPEPWTTRLTEETRGKVLVDERTLWPGGRFPTTVLVVRPEYLKSAPKTLEHVLRAHMESVRLLNSERDTALQSVNGVLAREIGKPLPGAILHAAARNLTFTSDVAPSVFERIANDAKALGLLKSAALDGVFELGHRDEVRSSFAPRAGSNGY